MTRLRFSAPRPPQRRRAPAHRPRAASWTMCSCRACCTWRSCAATTRTRAEQRRCRRPRARAPGVVAVYTADDLGDYCKPGAAAGAAAADPGPRVSRAARSSPLAQGQGPLCRRADRDDRRREPLHRRRRARATSSSTSIRSTRSSISRRRSAPARRCVHEHLGLERAAHVVQRKGDYAAARAKARRRRRAPVPLRPRRGGGDREPRGRRRTGIARAEELTIWDTTQAPIPIRNGLAAMLGLLESQVRVVAPFVGGGFGPKIMMFYPEELLVPWAAMRLGRPVKWTEDRQENFYATTQERGQVHDAEMALTRDGRILGVRDVFLFDTGAYDPYGLTIPINTQCTLLGPVRHPELRQRVHGGLHQQADRHAGARRGPAARRVRQRAAARHRRAASSASIASRSAGATCSARIAFRTTTRSCSRTRRRSSTTAATTCRRSSRRPR